MEIKTKGKPTDTYRPESLVTEQKVETKKHDGFVQTVPIPKEPEKKILPLTEKEMIGIW